MTSYCSRHRRTRSRRPPRWSRTSWKALAPRAANCRCRWSSTPAGPAPGTPRISAASGAARPEIRISKQKLDADIARLVDRVSPNRRRWRAVIGVAHGGIYPAGKVADGLGLAYDEIEVRGYRGREKSGVEIIRGLHDPAGGNGPLIVDDVVDSGDTALAIRDMLP